VAAAGVAFSGLAAIGSGFGRATVRLLEGAARLVRGRGRSGGAVQVELTGDGEDRSRAALSCAEGGQRMAALPLVFALERLLAGAPPGAFTAAELVPDLLERLIAAGHDLTTPWPWP
jgi:hypothetical protein